MNILRQLSILLIFTISIGGCAIAATPIYKVGSLLGTGKMVVDYVCHPKPYKVCMYQLNDRKWYHESELNL